jgi:septal ring factor EnvC (AmiA/AmiB activator)
MPAFDFSFVDICLFTLIVGLFVLHVNGQRKKRRQLSEMDEKRASVEKYQEKKLDQLAGESAWMKKVVFEKMKGLKKLIDELTRHTAETMKSVDEKVAPITSGQDEMSKNIRMVQDNLGKRINEHDKNLKLLSEELKNVSGSIGQITEQMREHMIDQEI